MTRIKIVVKTSQASLLLGRNYVLSFSTFSWTPDENQKSFDKCLAKVAQILDDENSKFTLDVRMTKRVISRVCQLLPLSF